ncbi:IclR family transcriptional regulator [Microbacterium sp. cf332]|uniref:IclR family transcriptional regulator n=1 Tax=Microbacterium sp. cf332 TaxID=1761804 RepID=UPI000889987E|nr:IclR family transcriptional regulator [Microbacterium sp. cf332]SDQ54571.1 transcriptional regulator, IclR family [Microbacterium sp. cf332]
MPTPTESNTMRSLERAIDVLEVLDSSRQPLRLTEVARRAGLHVATTQRILNVLEARGRVERDDGGYRPGVALLFGAHAYLLTSPLVASALPHLQDLATATGLTASLFVRTGLSRAVVSRIEGVRPMRYVLPVGERLTLTQGAGKVLAAYLSEAELDDLLASGSSLDRADGTRVTERQFRKELVGIRRDGFSWSSNGRAIGVASIAAPIHDRAGHCVAGVQIAASTSDLTEADIPTVSIEVRRAAAAIMETLL